MKKYILLLTLFLNFAVSSFSLSPFEPEVVSSFAQNLYETGFWDEAESEFKRALFLSGAVNQNPFSKQTEQNLFSLTTIYNANNDLDGLMWLQNNFSSKLNLDIKEKLDFSTTRLLFLSRNEKDFINFTNSIEKDLTQYSITFNALTTLSKDLFSHNISLVAKNALEISNDLPQFQDFSNACSSYNTKNAALATTLSILIPGAGKWYTGNFSSFISSFLSIGSFVAGTVYTGIESQWKSPRPYIFGTCALVLYIVDIYGANKAAKRYNNAQYLKLFEQLDSVYEKSF